MFLYDNEYFLTRFRSLSTLKTTENADENGSFRKQFQEKSLLKTHRFEKAPFLMWIGENGGF